MSDEVKPQPINPSLGMRITLAGIRQRFSAVPQISTDELYSLFYSEETRDNNKKLLLLDVRTQEERDISQFKDAVFVDYDKPKSENVENIRRKINEILSSFSSPECCLYVVAYCAVGYRSCDIINQLLPHYDSQQIKLYNLEGSIFKWANEGRPVVTNDNQPIKFVHPFNSVWGKLLNVDLRKWS
uniref:Uncharacterized protein LOC104266301 n=1 Tax=Phallusia mammillata TaxID=59560 RepID=A0A6F9DJ26_9ASCI|nr:uncharacterized protein LOC104266301 [Phallusia mammillata]